MLALCNRKRYDRAMQPEQSVVVTITERDISCSRPGGVVESVTWDDLQAVIIETTDTGPLAPDVFWILVGKRGGCVIPQGATGEQGLLDRLQVLDGFDNEMVIQAMASCENQRFLCWRKKTPAL
jgi:hypothetical protein